MLLEQLPLQAPVRLPLLGQLPLGVAVLCLPPARLLLCLVQLTLQGADSLSHLEDQSQRSSWTHKTGLTARCLWAHESYVRDSLHHYGSEPMQQHHSGFWSVCCHVSVRFTRSFCSLAILCSSSIWSLSSLIFLSSLPMVLVRTDLFLHNNTNTLATYGTAIVYRRGQWKTRFICSIQSPFILDNDDPDGCAIVMAVGHKWQNLWKTLQTIWGEYRWFNTYTTLIYVVMEPQIKRTIYEGASKDSRPTWKVKK